MVTSTLPREGKSTVTRDLALVYADAGNTVLVIDGDLRKPSMQRLFGLEPETGLVQVLREEASLSEAAITAIGTRRDAESPNGNASATIEQPAGGSSRGIFARARARRSAEVGRAGPPGSVDVVTHGEHLENPLALMSAERMAALFKEASAIYDVVLLDTSPVLTVADSVPLMEVVDSVLLVARLGQTTRQSAERFKELIGRLPNVNLAGVIANDRREKVDDEGYGFYGSYGYGYSRSSKRRARREEAAQVRAS